MLPKDLIRSTQIDIKRRQEAQSAPSPVLIRIETRAGYGLGKPTNKIIEEIADSWAFLVKVLEMDEERVNQGLIRGKS